MLQPARIILATGLAFATLAALSACGQKGPLFLPHTPAAQQRATLPQTMFGGAHTPAQPASAASAPAPAASAPGAFVPALPDLPDPQ
jgi:predicted small lipoprotein YifL